MPGKFFKSQYIDFRNSVVLRNQFIPDATASGFLDGIRNSAESRVVQLKKGSDLFRAQYGCVQKYQDEHPIPLQCHSAKRMRPDRKFVKAGRANAEYKAVFYAAVTPEVAIKEMRPWIGAYLSVAQFRTKKDLRIVNLFDVYKGFEEGFMLAINRSKLTGKNFDDYVWHTIGEAFCQPVMLSDEPHGYLPTQIIAELIKSMGYDGLAYRSSVEHERKSQEDAVPNVALFDVNAVSMQKKGWVVRITDFQLEFDDGPHY